MPLSSLTRRSDMKVLHLLLALVPALSAPSLAPDAPPSDSHVRVERFLQLWGACDSITEEYRACLGDGLEIEARHQRYILSLYWRAELEAYATLTDSERTLAWRLTLSGRPNARQAGEQFHQKVLNEILPATPTVS